MKIFVALEVSVTEPRLYVNFTPNLSFWFECGRDCVEDTVLFKIVTIFNGSKMYIFGRKRVNL